jgi:ubiquinone biosynthesis protein
MEWMDAISIFDLEGLKKLNHDLEKISKNLALTFFTHAFSDGFFHADLHPGNIMINKNGQIVLLDFGIMGRLEQETQIFVAEILYGFLKKDYARVAKVHFAAGYVPQNKSKRLFIQAIRSIAEPIVGLPVAEISVAELLSRLISLTRDFDMPTQPQLILLQKTMLLVEGIGYRLNPKINIWSLIEPWIEDWAIRNIGIEAKISRFVSSLTEYVIKKIREES